MDTNTNVQSTLTNLLQDLENEYRRLVDHRDFIVAKLDLVQAERSQVLALLELEERRRSLTERNARERRPVGRASKASAGMRREIELARNFVAHAKPQTPLTMADAAYHALVSLDRPAHYSEILDEIPTLHLSVGAQLQPATLLTAMGRDEARFEKADDTKARGFWVLREWPRAKKELSEAFGQISAVQRELEVNERRLAELQARASVLSRVRDAKDGDESAEHARSMKQALDRELEVLQSTVSRLRLHRNSLMTRLTTERR